MNNTFYTQFVPIYFKLLDNKKFMDFIGTSAFKTYIVLRRNVWRSNEEHYMGLHKYSKVTGEALSILVYV